MANKKQLEILMSGADNWNSWRKENPLALIDLSHADLSGMDLTKVNLKSSINWSITSAGETTEITEVPVDLVKSLDSISPSKAFQSYFNPNLTGANLSSSDLSGLDLRLIDLSGADLSISI